MGKFVVMLSKLFVGESKMQLVKDVVFLVSCMW